MLTTYFTCLEQESVIILFMQKIQMIIDANELTQQQHPHKNKLAD